MKVIVAGVTGMAGAAIARACLQDARITKVLVLTRKAVAEDIERDPKSETILHEDFAMYPTELMAKLEGAEACLWAIGGRVDQLNYDKVYTRKVNVELTLAAARAMNAHLAPVLPPGKKFRFVFCSGRYAEWDQTKTLFFLGDTRRIKGEVERGLCDLADSQEAKDRFESWIIRPQGLLDENSPTLNKLFIGKMGFGIETAQVGKAMVRIACEGAKERILENEALVRM